MVNTPDITMDIIDPENPPNSLYSGSSGYPDEPLDWPDILIIVLYFVIVVGVGIGVSLNEHRTVIVVINSVLSL